MAEYTDRVDLIATLHNLCKINCAHYPHERDIYCGMCMLNDVLNLIKGRPIADVQPVVHGYWINEPDRYFHWHCSECGYVISGPHREFNYCPKCGTKMHGDK